LGASSCWEHRERTKKLNCLSIQREAKLYTKEREGKERETKVGTGVWIWWTDGSRSDDSRVGAAAVCKHRDGWRAFGSHLGTGRTEDYDAEMWAIGLALRESLKKWDTLRTHGVTKVAGFSDSQAAI
jgi:hypothetical protein